MESIALTYKGKTVYLKDKSKFQKEDCINCNKKSTLEVFYRNGLSEFSIIRCCNKITCILAAARLATKVR